MTERTKRSPQQIAEDHADRAYAGLVAARERDIKAKAVAAEAAAKRARAEAKFQHAITDIDISDPYRDKMIALLEAEIAETATVVQEDNRDAGTGQFVSADEAAADPGGTVHEKRELPPKGPSATKTEPDRSDYIDGLPANDGGVPAAEKPLPEDELAARIHEAATRGDIPREIGSPDEEGDGPAVLEDAAEVPGEEPIVP